VLVPAVVRNKALAAGAARWLSGHITAAWPELGRPCSERAVEHALACAARRAAAHDDKRAVLVHGDVHEWNVLEAPGAGFKLVDPDGLLALSTARTLVMSDVISACGIAATAIE
jgi:streptomycin 6-kinase